ncbi:MAG TPA: signal recognition particle-docking protein FtsY [Actinomycetota bacterium]|nr:signal recognition particle-docking protein FtsY [Actinomycetota bacterium]
MGEAPAPARVPTALRPAPPAPSGLGERIRSLFRGRDVSADTWQELEDALVRADVGPKAARDIVGRVRSRYEPESDPLDVVTDEIARTFEHDQPWSTPVGSPAVVMVVGVNGTGKTTTIGKLAQSLRREGRTVSLANSDTFRAAAAEQLTTWADRAGAHLVAQARGADPGAVAFDAVQAAKSRGADVLIVDTAGRLHTRQPLMEELAKVKRVLEKAGGRVDEVLLVLDATTGQNGIAQARGFMDAVDVTGLVLAKMDGTARGGVVLSVREELGVPVKMIGTGEGIDDLERFDARAFARRLVS